MSNTLSKKIPSFIDLVKLSLPGWTWYRISLLMILVIVLSLQKFTEVRQVLKVPALLEIKNDGNTKLAIGIVVSLLLFVILLEYATLFVATRVRSLLPITVHRPPTTCSYRWHRFGFFILAGLFLFGSLQSRLLSGYIQSIPVSPSLWVAITWLVVWLVFTVASLWFKPESRIEVTGFVSLVVLTRIYAYHYHPFVDIGGDMLSTIDRSQDLLLEGKFPYIDEPSPAMPYWPGTFLLYTLPKLLGFDYRIMNLLAEIATVFVATSLGTSTSSKTYSVAARMALPVIMLFPIWTYYSAETQYPISILLAVLFCRSLTSFNGTSQAVILGVAVAVNQTFGVFGLFILPFWIREFSFVQALRLTWVALITCALIICPFVIWNAGEFFRVTLLSLTAFNTDQLAGRFSFRPLVDGFFPHSADVLLVTIIMFVMAIVYCRRMNGSHLAVVVALGYCGVLLLLHRTFSHYFLPVIAMILSIPHQENDAPKPSQAGNTHTT